MRVAVTGAAGFCGGRIAQFLELSGHDVVSVGRTDPGRWPHRRWDGEAPGVPDLTGCDAVVHAAAAVGDPRPGESERFRRMNVDGARRLLDAAGHRRVVWISSGSVYRPAGPSPVAETHPLVGAEAAPYAATKAAGDVLAQGAGAVVLRPTAVYGHGDRHLLPRLARLVRRNVLLLPGPDVRLSLTWVDHLAGASTSALAWEPGAYNIADPEPYSRDEVLLRVLGRHVGRDLRPVRLPLAPLRLLAGRVPGLTDYGLGLLTHERFFDVSRALGAGWQPTRTRVFDLG